MIFKVSSSTLSSNLQAIGRAISPKPVYPILNDFLIVVEKGKLSATASDNDITMEAVMDIIEGEEGTKICIPAKTLLDTLKSFSEQPLTFNVNPETFATTIQYQNGECQMVGHNPDEFPAAAVFSAQTTKLETDSAILSHQLDHTIFAIAEDELRPIMNGVLFDAAPTGLTLVASDGKKLVRCTNPTSTSELKTSFVLPKKPATLFKTLLGNESESVSMEFDSRITKFTVNSFTMTCRLSEGKYPNYQAVLPKETDLPFTLTIDRATFAASMRRAALFTSDGTQLVKLRLQDGSVTIIAKDFDNSKSANEQIPCSYDGNPLTIGFKAQLLIDVANNMSGDNISIKIADSSRPALAIPTVPLENEDLVILLMPMILND